MPTDPIMDMHRQGLTPREIGIRVGRTRNAVIGYIWRYKKRGGPPKPVKANMGRKPRATVPPHEFRRMVRVSVKKYGDTPKARSVAMYLVSVSLGYGPMQTAKAFDCWHTTIVAANRRVEDWRDDPVFDEGITALEQKNSPGS